MAKERTCMICGRTYKFCHHCKEYESEPKWKYLFHDEKCKKIGDVWYAYRGNEISKEEARKTLGKLKPNIDDALKYTGTIASNEIRAIFDVEENEQVLEKQNVENVQKESIEEVNTSEKPVRKRNQKKESHVSE